MENRSRTTNDDPRPGDTIDERFRVIRRLTPARSGWRWLVEQVPLGRQVDLVLLEATPGSPDVAARFEREAQALCRLSHPNVLRVFDRGTWNGRPYLVTEHIDGPSLAEILAEGPMDPGRLIALVRQIASALGDAHENGLVHRDLRPENVRVLRHAVDDEVARVVDFGLVEDLGPTSADITEPGSMVGTPAYMAPEQIRGGYIDRRADVYGLGVMLYRGLVGWVPFEGAAGKIFQAQLEELPPPFPADIVLPPVMEWTTRVCLAKDPRDRFASMAELSQALRACSVALVDPPLWDVVLKLKDGQTVVPPELADPGASWSTSYRTPAPIPRAAQPPAEPPAVEAPRIAPPAPTPAPAAKRPVAPAPPPPAEPPPAPNTARNGMMGLAVLGVTLIGVLGVGAIGLAIAGVGMFGRAAPQPHDAIAIATPPAPPPPLIDRAPDPAPPIPDEAPPPDPTAGAGTADPAPADVAPEPPVAPAATAPIAATPVARAAAPEPAPATAAPATPPATAPTATAPARPPGTPDAAPTAPPKVDPATTAKTASPASDEGTASPAPPAATSTTAAITTPATPAASAGTAAPGIAGPRTFHVSEVKVKRQLPFEYPEPARKLGLGDTECKVRVVLDLQGAPVRIDDVSCPKAFSQAAKDTLMKWRWVAPEVGGQPVEAQFLMTVRYTVR